MDARIKYFDEQVSTVAGKLETASEEIEKVKEDLHKKCNEMRTEIRNEVRQEIEDAAKVVATSSPALSTTSSQTSSRALKAPEFDGQTTWSIYKAQFEAAAKVNHWNEQERAKP